MGIFRSNIVPRRWFTFNELEIALQAFLTLGYVLALVGIVLLDIALGDTALLQSIINFVASFAGVGVLMLVCIFLFATVESASLPFRKIDQTYLVSPQRMLKVFVGFFTTASLLLVAFQSSFNIATVYDTPLLLYGLYGYICYLIAKALFFLHAAKEDYPFKITDVHVAWKIVLLYVVALFCVNVLTRMMFSSELAAFMASLIFIQCVSLLHKRQATHTF